ncbi:MAG: hypothetical protein QM831_06270 [Kofleriaceae bacterium]
MWRFAVVSAFIGCAPAFDDTRTDSDPGTFGHHVVDLLCNRLSFEANPTDVSGSLDHDVCHGGDDLRPDAPVTLEALIGDRPRTVAAIDEAVPPDQTDALQLYLTSDDVLSAYDDNTMANSVQSLGDMLSELGDDPDAMVALTRYGARDGYRQPDVVLGQTSVLVNAPEITAVLDNVLPAIASNGPAHESWNALIRAIGATMASAAPNTDADRTAVIADKLLLTEDAEVATGTSQFIVRRDNRGVARLTTIAPPFVDTDGDGLPDTNALGQYVGADGTPILIATPFATAGDTSARDANGLSTVAPYVYLDLDRTILGALARDSQQLLDPTKHTAFDLVRSSSILLGDRVQAVRTFDDGSSLTYQGYDTSDAPLLDLAYGFSQLLRDSLADDTLALAQQLFTSHESVMARLTEDMILTARLGDMFPDAQIADNAPLWDDMRPLLQKITADPKLVHDLLVALEDPGVQQLGDRFREEMTYNDQFDIAADQTVTGAFTSMPDRTRVDDGFNRSLFERLLNVISDSQVSQCNKQGAKLSLIGLGIATYDQCAFFSIPNLAVFYTQAIAYAKDANGNIICEDNGGEFDATHTATTGAGCAAFGSGWRPRPKANFNYNWNNGLSNTTAVALLGGDHYVETQAGITGFRTHPTPEALNRVLFLDPTPQTIQDTADPMRDKYGQLFKVAHTGTLPVWEKNNFYAEIRPIVQAFADANQEQTFVDILSVLHKHWASPNSTTTQHSDPNGANYTFGSNGVSWEPFIIAVLQTDLYPALTQSAAELVSVTANGKPMTQIAAHAANYLVSPLAGLTDRQNNPTGKTADGQTITTLTPWNLIADGFVGKRRRLMGAGAIGSAMWTDSIHELADILMRGDNDASGWHFHNAHFAATTRALIQMLRDRLAVHVADRDQWIATDLPKKVEDTLTHPVLAGAADLLVALDDTSIGALEALLVAVLDPTKPSFATMRASAAELLQLGRDDQDLVPVARVTGRLLGKQYLPDQINLLNRLHKADVNKTLNDIVARLFQSEADAPGVPLISAIADGVGDVNRVTPAPGHGVWNADDYASVFHVTADFLREQKHGLLRFVAIVKGRNP